MQLEIRQQEVGRRRGIAGPGQRLPRARMGNDAVPLALEQLAQQAAQIVLVLDEQDDPGPPPCDRRPGGGVVRGGRPGARPRRA